MIQCLFLHIASRLRDGMKANTYRSHQYFCLWVYIASFLVKFEENFLMQLSCQLLRELSFVIIRWINSVLENNILDMTHLIKSMTSVEFLN